MARRILRRVLRRLPSVIYDGQDEEGRRSIMRAFDDATSLVDEIKQKVRVHRLTLIAREQGLRQSQKQRAGTFTMSGGRLNHRRLSTAPFEALRENPPFEMVKRCRSTPARSLQPTEAV